METDKKIVIFHLSERKLPLSDLLDEKFTYIEQSNITDLAVDGKPVLKKGKLSGKFYLSVFLLDAESTWLKETSDLSFLPANQIVIDRNCKVPEKVLSVLQLKNVHIMDFSNLKEVSDNLNYYFDPHDGGGAKTDFEKIQPVYQNYSQLGKVAYRFKITDPEWSLLAFIKDMVYIPAAFENSLAFEYKTSTNVKLKVQLEIYNSLSFEYLRTETISSPEDLADFRVKAPTDFGYLVQVSYFAKGEGTLDIGTFSTSKSRGQYGIQMLNSGILVDENNLHGEVIYYFNSGNLRPPLNIYFSGYATFVGFEGAGMMSRFEHPYLLFADSRLDGGGSFYLGDTEFENKLVQVIKETLSRLNFNEHDLIFSGLSMGTFAALYFGSFFKPHAIVIGKPLIHLGAIAQNNRIKRPDDFLVSEDMNLFWSGDDSSADLEKLNQHFDERFVHGDFGETTFAISYMEDDDYDLGAFNRLQAFLKKKYPTSKILSKGIIGRHNDDTTSIVAWFVKQYWHIIRHDFEGGEIKDE